MPVLCPTRVLGPQAALHTYRSELPLKVPLDYTLDLHTYDRQTFRMDGQNTKPALDRVPTVPLTAGWSVKKHSGAGGERVVIPRSWGLKSLPGL